MQLFKKTVCFMLVLGVIPSAIAATSRVATNTGARVSAASAASRAPTLTLKSSGSTTTTTSTTTSSSLLANAECINTYNDCIKGADVCGENFEECTTKVLFHAQMPKCLSTLAQCSSDGVNSLFGTTNIASLSNVASKNSYGEVTDYTYPTDGSVLGQMISAASISNRYDTSTCIRRYTSCLKKENVCGNDFELCTTDKEFKKQRVFCDSTLARCSGEGVTELLGSSALTATPTKSSRVGEMITEGASLAAIAAVSTCYKVIDNCILNACAENPYKCYENSNQSVVELVDAINNGTPVSTELVTSIVNKSSIAAYIKNSCLDTIGGSKYCYATFIGNGQMPTNAQLRDEDNQQEIYDEAYSTRMNAALKAKIADLVDNFDKRAKQKCTETVKSCAMRVCGGGVGAACYAAVFGNSDKSINGSATYDEIKTGCSAIVNTDANCKYAAANPDSTGTYSYTYINRDAFDTLFPEYDDGAEKDVIGVVASLNSALATNYSDAALAQMKKQCQSVATSCVRSMCGSDFVNCYRNRTDIYSDLTNTGETTFDRSMNKVGGVLDYTVVLGLCLDTIKNASVCEEHLAIETSKIKLDSSKYSDSWNSKKTVRDGWIDAGSATSITGEGKIYATDENGNTLCSNANGARGICNTMGPDKSIYDTPIVIGYETYVQSLAAESLFQDLIYDIEKEAQATYNAKLTKEQNMCMSSNNGGIVSNKDTGSTFMWAKLKSNKVPSDYNVNGLKSTAFTASNDLYGSFCRVRVTLQSDDKKIQEYMRNQSWTTAYFAIGDSFTCGSWIPERDLERMADEVASEKVGSIDDDSLKRTRFWTGVLGGIAGGIGGVALGEGIRNGNVLGGLTGLTGNDKKVVSDPATNAKSCLEQIENFGKANKVQERKRYAEGAARYAEAAGANSVDVKNVKDLAKNYECQKYNGGRCQTEPGSVKEISLYDNDMKNALETLKGQCEEKQGAKPTEKDRSYWGITAGATAISTLIGGWTVYKATKDIQQSELDADQKAAYQEWMNNVGRHITCYIGGDEAGSYGDIITTSLE